MRPFRTSFLLLAAVAALSTAVRGAGLEPRACAARISEASTAVAWPLPPDDDRDDLDAWCRGVGPPLYVPASNPSAEAPPLADLVVISWNAHLAAGRLDQLVSALRTGALTGGRRVEHFVLLLQEVFRRGDEVPVFRDDARSAIAIAPRDPDAPDIAAWARSLGLHTLYVPSMRNGTNRREDRGNAILSTAPLHQPLAYELPLERQRRVAVGAAVDVRTEDGVARLQLVDAHLEPLSAPSALWLFRNPRRRQIAALLTLLRQPIFDADAGGTAGTVLGGDFNTIQGGDDEAAYALARAWSRSLGQEDTRSTHRLGRIDYLFFRLRPGWSATTVRVDATFGSDHHPVLGSFIAEDQQR